MDEEKGGGNPEDRDAEGTIRTVTIGIPVDIILELIPEEGYLASSEDFPGILVLDKDPLKAKYIVAERVRHHILNMLYEAEETNEQTTS